MMRSLGGDLLLPGELVELVEQALLGIPAAVVALDAVVLEDQLELLDGVAVWFLADESCWRSEIVPSGEVVEILVSRHVADEARSGRSELC